MLKPNRNRGHVLIQSGSDKLHWAIRQWENDRGVRCTQEKIRDLTSMVRPNGLDASTIRKILKGKEGVDLDSIRCLFQAFNLQLSSEDFVLANRVDSQLNPNFVGRARAIAELNNLVREGAKIITIQGRGGIGKTTLAQKFLKEQAVDLMLEKWMATEPQNITSVESAVEEWLRRYFDEEPGREFGITLDRLRYRLRHSSRRVGILLDNFETALDGNGRLIEPHRRYVDLLRVLADSEIKCLTLIVSRERLCDAVHVEHYLLKGLDLDAWQQFFQEKDIQAASAIPLMHQFYDGNASAMKILRSTILGEYEGDAKAYWKDNQHSLPGELDYLVNTEFDRLKQVSADEYKLLCRLGCYRYQDVSSVPIEGVLCLLWDVAEPQRRRVVDSLQRRSLLDYRKDQYWLHPVICMEAVRRLRATDDWEPANRRAASYLSQSTASVQSTKDALRALEAYYHYLQINDLPAAADTLIAKRPNKWGTNESLGRSFYKRGLMKQMTNVIVNVVDDLTIEAHLHPQKRLEQAHRKAKLYHTLGAIHWLTGDIHAAIQYCQNARALASTALSQHEHAVSSNQNNAVLKLKLVEINALLTTGMCRIGLWELNTALSTLLEALTLCQSIDCNKYSPSVLFYVAFLQSYLGSKEEALAIANHVYSRCEPLLTHSLPSWLTEYRLSYLGQTYNNLGQTEKALTIYDHVIVYTEKNLYTQANGKSLHTQAKAKVYSCKAEIYRQQKRFEEALSYHDEAIETARVIGAKYDFAEALCQQGLTYREMNQPEKSQQSFEAAIQLFNGIQAPKQIDRVRTMMG